MMAAREPPCIRPLPAHVVAQLKSATAIVSLTGVVVELLKNALDAGATKAEAVVDFGRGGCTVDDDGLGISPFDFTPDGGLGRLYFTSKYYSDAACLGRHGTFLASLAAVSLLTITSRHHQHRSLNSVTLHHSQPVERQLPAQAGREIKYDGHGTRVTVRNLFGNLPVRVKQRALLLDQTAEQHRLWELLKRDVTALWLAWQQPVKLSLRNAANQTVCTFTGQTPSLSPIPARADYKPKRRPSGLQYLLETLTQAGYISIQDWSSWVPASASTSTLSIKGAISLEPAPTKRVQFLSLDIQPLSADAAHNELFDHVNRLFSLSSFGTVEDEVYADEGEKLRRAKDRRFKTDGYAHRQLKGRKGVDRHPKFHLRISLRDGTSRATTADQLLEQEPNLRAITEVLTALVTQWLSVHHFRPRKPRTRTMPTTASTSCSGGEQNRTEPSSGAAAPAHDAQRSAVLRHQPTRTHCGNRMVSPSMTEGSRRPERTSAFQDWSRIKSAKSDFYDGIWAAGKWEDTHNSEQPISRTIESPACTAGNGTGMTDTVPFDMEPILPGSLNTHTPSAHGQDAGQSSSMALQAPRSTLQPPLDAAEDKTIAWTDPTTKRSHLLNARTGCLLPDTRRPQTDSSASAPGHTQASGKPLRLPKRVKTADESRNQWLDDLLRTWDNPVFKATETPIQQSSTTDDEAAGSSIPSSRFHCSNAEISRALENELLSSSTAKLSRAALRNARVIAQIDRKFILARMSSEHEEGCATLVLVDQHAADERIRVEALLAELCTPLAGTGAQYRSPLGHVSKVACVVLDAPLHFSISTAESRLFITHAARFAAWGILYDVAHLSRSDSKESLASAQESVNMPVLGVTALPPSISERCRSDPKLLISFLRSTIWSFAENPLPSLATARSPDNHVPSATADEEDGGSTPLWLRRLSSCPQGLIDMINSRACRSAIMFNDELTVAECEELMHKAAQCVFPFMCAHGRPSMVPLVKVGGNGAGTGLGSGFGSTVDQQGGFVEAWQKWRR